MTRAAIAEARAFESWRDYQQALKRAIAPLRSAQLQRQLLPGLRTPGEIAEHIVFGRALHLQRTLGERAAELTSLLRWEDTDDPPHTAAEIVQGLELTWQFITDCLMRGSPADAVPEAAIWAAITNIEHTANIISGIEHIEVVEKPAHGLVGLKWRETRMLFGKPATVEKWITDAAEYEFYTTRAEDNGFVFVATMGIAERSGGMRLTSAHETRPQGIVARLQALPMFLFKGVVKKALVQDLNDYKSTVEQERSITVGRRQGEES